MKFEINNSPDSYRDFISVQESLLCEGAARSTDAEKAWFKERERANIDFNSMNIEKNSFITPFYFDSFMIKFSKYWQKLQGKTQIFVAPNDFQFITRSAHTGYVEQIADQTATGLSLNRELTRAIAAGHDIGHTAFGHNGEYELDDICQEHFCYTDLDDLKSNNETKYEILTAKFNINNNDDLKKVPVLERLKNEDYRDQLSRDFYVQEYDRVIFSHSKQSFRFLCVLDGKQLKAQTIHGMVGHNQPRNHYLDWKIEQKDYLARVQDQNPLRGSEEDGGSNLTFRILPEHSTYEGQIVKFADVLSFSIHDLDDALRAGIIDIDTIRNEINNTFPDLKFSDYFIGPKRYSFFINQFQQHNSKKIENGESLLEVPSETREMIDLLMKKIIVPLVHNNKRHKTKTDEARRYIRGLYELWVNQNLEERIREKAPKLAPEIQSSFGKGYTPIRKFCDFISIMSDAEIINLYQSIFNPEESDNLFYDF